MTSMSSITMMLNMRVMTNNMAAVMNLLVFFLTVSMYNFLALLNVSGVDNLLALLVLLFLGDLGPSVLRAPAEQTRYFST